MALITITAASVIPSANAHRVTNNDGSPTKAAVAFTAGAVAYQLLDGTFGLCDADATTPAFNPCGIYENSGGAGQVCSIIDSDPALVLGGTSTLGKVLITSATAGRINEYGDQATGWHIATLGLMSSSTVLNFQITPVATPAIA